MLTFDAFAFIQVTFLLFIFVGIASALLAARPIRSSRWPRKWSRSLLRRDQSLSGPPRNDASTSGSGAPRPHPVVFCNS